MNSYPLISILLPTYNRANLLDTCIMSVISQSYSNWELIISDDASSDDTTRIASQWVEKDPRIYYFKNNNREGLPANRNIAISYSHSEFIFFIEDDLVLEKDCLFTLRKTFLNLSNSKKIGALAPRLISIDKEKYDKQMFEIPLNTTNSNLKVCRFDNKTGIVTRNFEIDSVTIQEVPDVHACSLYSKRAILESGGYEEHAFQGNYTYEEVDLNFRLSLNGYSLFFQPDARVYHLKASLGGVRINSPILSNYYIIRNHMIFLWRNFRFKSFYMGFFYFVNRFNRLFDKYIRE